jgi:hypothetical protein
VAALAHALDVPLDRLVRETISTSGATSRSDVA